MIPNLRYLPRLFPLITLIAGVVVGYLIGGSSAGLQSQTRSDKSRPGLGRRLDVPSEEPARRSLSAKPPELKPITEEELQNEMRYLGAPLDLLQFTNASFRAVADLQDRLRSSDVAGMAASMSASALPPRPDVYRMVMSVFAEAEPEQAWTLACGVRASDTRLIGQLSVLTTLMERNSEQAMAMIESLPEALGKLQLKVMAFQSLGQRDPKRAWELFQQSSLASDEDFNQLSSGIFESWALRDPGAAKAAAQSLPGNAGDQIRSMVAATLARSDPQAAWAYARSIPFQGDGRGSPLVRVVRTWAEWDPRSAAQAAASIEDVRVKEPAMSVAIREWCSADFDGALGYVIGEKDPGIRSEIFREMSARNSLDRQKLLNAVLEHIPPGDNYQRAISSLFDDWADADPRSAAAALKTVPAGNLNIDVTARIADKWSERSDKTELLAWVRQLPEGAARSGAYTSVFLEWSFRSPQEAVVALSGLSGEDRRIATQAIATGWSRKDPEALVRWSVAIQDPGQRAEILTQAIGEWARYSPEKASRHWQTMSPEMQDSSLAVLVRNWSSRDLSGAAEWLRARPSSPARDSAIWEIGERISREDPANAIAWAGAMSDPNRRDALIKSLAKAWLRLDAVSARSWIAGSNLSAEMRAQILK